MRNGLVAVLISTTCFVLAADATVARADGGAVRLSQRVGNRVITVFTTPTPVCVGAVDISVLVQDADSTSPLLDEPIEVQIAPLDRPNERTIVPATSAAATNKLLRAARLDLPEPGLWRVDILTPGTSAGPPIGFDMEVAGPPAEWPDLSLWIGWPLAAIGLFAVHQWLVHRRNCKN